MVRASCGDRHIVRNSAPLSGAKMKDAGHWSSRCTTFRRTPDLRASASWKNYPLSGIAACSLLVIPNHHRRGHFLDDPVFCRWLKAQAQAGTRL
jgi:hypothetical protein